MNTDSNDLNREEIRAEENAAATDAAEENEEEKKKRVLPVFWLKKALIVWVALLSLFLVCFTAFWWKPWNGKAPDVTAETSSAEEASEAVQSGSKGEEISAAEPAGPSSYSSPYEAPSTDERPPAAKSAATPRQPNINSERQESSGEVSETAAVQTQAPTPAPAVTPEPTPAPTPVPAPAPAPVHTHTWVHHDAVTHTVHHDATYSTVHHDAVTEQRWVVDAPSYDITQCTGCGAQFTDVSAYSAHSEAYALQGDMSHGNTVITVPEQGHYETVTVSEAYDETVETSPAWDETVVDSPAYDECSGCGARQ